MKYLTRLRFVYNFKMRFFTVLNGVWLLEIIMLDVKILLASSIIMINEVRAQLHVSSSWPLVLTNAAQGLYWSECSLNGTPRILESEVETLLFFSSVPRMFSANFFHVTPFIFVQVFFFQLDYQTCQLWKISFRFFKDVESFQKLCFSQ